MSQMENGQDGENQVLADHRDAQTYAIIGAAMEVHGQLGSGFLEPVYQHAMAIELGQRGVPFLRESSIAVTYKGLELACSYRADFICYESILVELKALAKLTNVEQSQVMNYLKATSLTRGLLLNFGAPRLEYKRFVQ